MTTPTNLEIVKKARELYVEHCYRSGAPELADLTPSETELSESGFTQTARSELMHCLETEHAEWLHNETLGFEEFNVDTKEAMQTTSFISGSRGVGKSDMAMRVVDRLNDEGVICIVFDPSMDWIRRSSIINFVRVKPYSDLHVPRSNTIFDISRLTPIEQQRCVERFCKKLFEHQIEDTSAKYYLMFEESQLFFPLNSLRSRKTQNSMRLLTVGRNFNVSICAISQFPALIDKELIKHSQQIWIGLVSELNTLKYWHGILGQHTEQLKSLSNGQFVYYHRNKISLTETEPYEGTTTKQEIIVSKPKPIQISEKPKTQTNNLEAVTSLASFCLWTILLLVVLNQIW